MGTGQPGRGVRFPPHGFGWYVVGYFDMLGHSNRLSEIVALPNDDADLNEAITAITCAALAIQRFRVGFKRFFTDPKGLADRVPPDRREYLLGRDRPRLVHWDFSDAYIVAAPVLCDSDGDMAVAVHDIYRIMYAAARMWLFSLDGAPIRGGIEMGLLAGIPPHDEPRELSGPALVRAYWLESQVAGYPRVMVGSACIRFLDDIAHGRVSGSSDEAIAGAEACLGLLCEASQEHAMLDTLNQSLLPKEAPNPFLAKQLPTIRDRCKDIHEWVRYQLSLVKGVKCNRESKLVRRYQELVDYFDRSASNWA